MNGYKPCNSAFICISADPHYINLNNNSFNPLDKAKFKAFITENQEVFYHSSVFSLIFT